MAYTINNYDGTLLATIADGQIDSTTSLLLPGPNYVGYGKDLNENLVYLLENFAGNTAPSGTNLQGQLWFNKSAQTLNVFTNQGYVPVSGIIVSSTQPLVANPGNTWFSTVTNQYRLYDGTNWNLIGPTYTKDQGVSGAIPVTVGDADTSGVTHNIIKIQFGPFILAILSSDPAFRPSPSMTGFATINPGITLNSTITNPVFNSNIVGRLTGDVVGNLTGSQVTATNLTGTLTGAVNGDVIGNITSTLGIVNNFSSGNVLVSGGTVSGLTALSTTTAQATNFSSGNAIITGGSVNGIDTLSVTTAQATNFSSGNAIITGGSATGLSTLSATTAQATNFSSGNILVTGGNITGLSSLRTTTAQATNFSSGNILVTGGTVSGLSTLSATTAQATNFSSGNAQITGGNIGGLSTLQSANFSTANALITSGSATTLTATNFSSANVILGTASVTTLVATNFSSGNIQGTFSGTFNGTVTASATTMPYSTSNTSVATTAFVQNVLPQGVIVMWGGSVASIPAGWHLCDGTNGTPDLRGQFIIGAGGAYSPSNAGGAATATLATTNLPSHNHSLNGVSAAGTTGPGGSHSHTATSSVTDVGHTHSTSENPHSHSLSDPGHQHNIGISGGNGSVNLGNNLVGNPGQRQTTTRVSESGTTGITLGSASTGLTLNSSGTGITVATSLTTASAHTHSLSVTLSGTSGSTGDATPISILPPYYALCYIQKMF